MEYAFEIWIPIYIKNQKSKYSVSQYGRVINTKTGKILKPQKISRGYLGVTLSMGKKSFTKKIHRLVAIAFLDNPNKLPQVDHLDGNKHNNRVNNLEWVTPKINIRRAYAKGLMKGRKGSEHGNAKYTDTQIIKLCELMNDATLSRDDILKETGVNIHVLNKVRFNKRWKHISKNYDFTAFNQQISNNASKKFSDEQIIKLCELMNDATLSRDDILKETGVTIHVLNGVRRNKTWTHISKNYDFTAFNQQILNNASKKRSKKCSKKGSENINAKYTDTQIISVCNMLIENTLSYEDISRLTNVSKLTISRIKNKSVWKHITSKYDFSNYNKTMVNQYK